jgi:hypothetical protein
MGGWMDSWFLPFLTEAFYFSALWLKHGEFTINLTKLYPQQ